MIQYATAQIGAILVTINPAYRTEELEYVLNQSSVAIVLSAASFKTSDYAAMLDAVRGRCPHLDDVVIVGSQDWSGIAETVADAAVLQDVRAGLRSSDPINIQYTSGTTGFPKGATLTHSNILNNGYFVGEGLGYTEADRVCIPVPFYHCFGMVMGNLACTSHGAAMVIPAPGFDPEETLKAVAAQRCTSLYGVPTMFIAELSLPNFADYDLSSAADRDHGGVAVPGAGDAQRHRPHAHERSGDLLRHDRNLPGVHPDVADRHAGPAGEHRRAGRPAPGDPDRRRGRHPSAAGCTGRAVHPGLQRDGGLLERPDKTAEAIDADGWMHTGDIAVMDDDGYLSITGRIKDMVIRGGENVYPREVEEFLYTHPDIVDAQVVGVPDEKYGEELMAWIRVADGAQSPTAESLRAFCAGQIAHEKIPRYVQVVDEFPMTVTGKVRKVDLRRRGAELTGGSG